MSLTIKENDFTVSELKLPSPSDLCLGQISLKNCKDATIGTKIDGNVIVNQYFNDIPADKALSDGLTFTDSVVLEDWTQKLLKYKYVWISLILAVVTTTVLCILYIPNGKPLDNTEDPQPSFNFSLVLRTREQWSSSKSKLDCDDLKIHPAKYVVLSHTVTPMCNNPVSCQTTVTMIQSDHIRKGLCDIGYHFLIGDDGYIYEGLGWGKYGSHTYGFNCDSIGIAFIGNFNLDYPTDRMIQLYNLIVEEGVELNELALDYKLIAQKQVQTFASPGIHIEELMTKWKHWSLVTSNDYLYVAYSLNYTLKLRSRYNWSVFRAKLKDCDTLKVHPAKFVVVGHTASRTCIDPATCESIITFFQSDHIRKGFCDIAYNFIIGDDGYIYEGRGWGIYGAHTVGFNCNSIGIGLIGNFNNDNPSIEMLQMIQLLIEEGLRINEISQDYKLIFQSQVNQKISPGSNVEKVLKNWEHWSNITAEDRQCN